MSSGFVIGLGGLPGAGKSELSEQLTDLGVEYLHLGTLVRSTAKANGFVPDNDGREAYLPFWGEHALQHGRDWLSRIAFKHADNTGGVVLLDGIRIADDAEQIAASGNGSMVWLEASIQTIAERVVTRARDDDLGITEAEFVAKMRDDLAGQGSFSMGAVREASEVFLLPIPQIDDENDRTRYHREVAGHLLEVVGVAPLK